MNERIKPLTDPTDVVTLLGRFCSSAALCVLTLVLLIKGFWWFGAMTALVSLFFQNATVKLWRRLRDERVAAEAERAREAVEPPVSPAKFADSQT